MSNWLTNEINKHLKNTESVLDLCCGIGTVSDGFLYSSIVGVDACNEYLNVYKTNLPNSEIKQFDLSKIAESNDEVFSKDAFDNVLCIDGVEHLEKDDGIRLVDRIESIARNKVIIFTPENAVNPNLPTLNHPKNTWGISGGDNWQVHRSAFPRTFFADRGYQVFHLGTARNAYDGTLYHEMMYVLNKGN